MKRAAETLLTTVRRQCTTAAGASGAATMAATKTIGTHSGSFHADEAMACFMLRLTDTFRDARIVRTRDPDTLKSLDIVVDVGGVYDPATLRFDHHQREFTDTFSPAHTIRLSSAGLVYRHYGKEAIASVLGIAVDDERMPLLYSKVYEELIHGMDGIDNGVNQYPDDVQPRYQVHTDLAARVGRLNPAWNDKTTDVDAQFARAVEIAGEDFVSIVKYLGNAWLPARAIVERSLRNRHQTHASGRIVLLEEQCPWKEHLFTLEQELGLGEQQTILYMLYNGGDSWRVQAVPAGMNTFANRKSLPEKWRGLRDAELSAVVGHEGCVFVHASGFIGGAKTYEGALAMAVQALDL